MLRDVSAATPFASSFQSSRRKRLRRRADRFSHFTSVPYRIADGKIVFVKPGDPDYKVYAWGCQPSPASREQLNAVDEWHNHHGRVQPRGQSVEAVAVRAGLDAGHNGPRTMIGRAQRAAASALAAGANTQAAVQGLNL